VGRVKALTEQLQRAGAVALDTAVFIYAFESHPDYGPPTQAVFRVLETGLCRGYVSVLALGEILTGVKKAGDDDLLLRYRDVLHRFPGLTLVDADSEVMEKMSDLRVRYSLSTPDAIHLGTALARGARAFVTNDARLRRVTEIEMLMLADFVPG
jgi:predicted nucleic acid-binding protein